MGGVSSKRTSIHGLIFHHFLLMISFIALLSSPSIGSVFGLEYSDLDQQLVAAIANDIEIPANTEYYVHFDADQNTLVEQELTADAHGLSETIQLAIAKSPLWVQRALTQQFHALDDPEPYAALILKTNRKYVDEIAFSIAYSSLGHVPSPDVLWENALFLYENDNWIEYADIVDYDLGSGNYYSTVRYRVLEEGVEQEFEYPQEIYYWYIVHPELGGEDAMFIYDTFWREYLFYHNDRGYPLLKEKLSSISYLWDCQSYAQPANRLWQWSMNTHPTAIEAISYWIGKTVPYQATGDRPSQPNIIAHEHNGWCGELQRLAVAAQRAALIPSIGACNIGEDHVWREFYDRGWHQNDNWWTDGGGTVDQPDVYSYGWGKDMSAVFAWEGDDSIYDLTSTYIHPDDTVTVEFTVQDARRRPLDGARVTVTVVGIKDITWYKNLIWGKIQGIWDQLPELLKGRLLQAFYERIHQRFEEIPDVIDGLTITTWNYTNAEGVCSFELGKNCSYFFVIQQGNLRKPWQLARHNTFRILQTPTDREYQIVFSNLRERRQRSIQKEMPTGDCMFSVSYDAVGYQRQKSVRTDDVGLHETPGALEFFILDETNFNRYQQGRSYTCYQNIRDDKDTFTFSTAQQDWYLIFKNPTQQTHMVCNLSIEVSCSFDSDRVQIVSPSTTVFVNPYFSVGDHVIFTGIATDDVQLTLDGIPIMVPVIENKWMYLWNTSGLVSGDYEIIATCGTDQDDLVISLFDACPPEIQIETPGSDAIVENLSLHITGSCVDASSIDHVEVRIDDSEYEQAEGTHHWSCLWDLSDVDLGDHTISVQAFDVYGNRGEATGRFVLNESGHSWHPQINEIYHLPEQVSNMSNLIIYANVTAGSPFSVKKVLLYCDNGTTVNEYTMFGYAQQPQHGRHEEDPLYNQSNAPVYGKELGQFASGSMITYWVAAYDSAQNVYVSDEKMVVVE